MKTQRKYILAYWVIVLTIIIFSILYINGVFHPKIEVGQHWRKEYNIGNPFEESRIYDYFVIDVKDGYVLYIQNRDSYIDTMSMETEYFTWNKDLISK